jgi:hypothetical protein
VQQVLLPFYLFDCTVTVHISGAPPPKPHPQYDSALGQPTARVQPMYAL